MDVSALVIFGFAILIAAASPGPAVAAIIARVISRGPAGIAPFIGGIIAGDLVWLGLAILGLALVAQTFAAVFTVIKYAGAAYLLWLAYGLWTARAEPAAATLAPRGNALRAWLAGLALTLGNPKTIAFYLALTPTLIDVARVTLTDFLELALIIVLALTITLGGYAVAAARARALFASRRAMRVLNRSGGALMAGAAVAVVAR